MSRRHRGCRALAIALAAVTALGAAVAPAASGEGLRKVARAVQAFQTDGDRFALWTTGEDPHTRLVVLDTRTNTRRAVAVPAGCAPVTWLVDGALRAGHAVVDCRRVGEGTPPATHLDVDLAAATAMIVPDAAAPPVVTPEDVGPCGWLQAAAAEIAGALWARWEAPYLAVNTPVGAGAWLRLLACGRRPIVLDKHRSESAQVARGLVSWHTADDPWTVSDSVEYAPPHPNDRLKLYDVASHHTRAWRLPGVVVASSGSRRPRHIGTAWHTRDAAFWVAETALTCDKLCDPGLFDVYAARLR